MCGLESRLQGSGDLHTEHSGIYLPVAIFRWRLSVEALRFDSERGSSRTFSEATESEGAMRGHCFDLGGYMVGSFAAYNLLLMTYFAIASSVMARSLSSSSGTPKLSSSLLMAGWLS
jgi:hypothetical protein